MLLLMGLWGFELGVNVITMNHMFCYTNFIWSKKTWQNQEQNVFKAGILYLR